MMYSPQNLVAVAQSQIGYLEKKSNSQLDDFKANSGANDYTKYSRDLHEAGFFQGNKQGYPWCAVFVTWCAFRTTGSKEAAMELLHQLGPYGAGCQEVMDYYKECNAFGTTPQVGDQIFFTYRAGEISHTGIVETVNDSTITTIEGNTSACVARRVYARNDSTIVGYGHPRFTSDEFDWTSGRPDVMVLGSEGAFVEALQRIINEYTEFNCGAPDGIFGKNTDIAVREVQAFLDLEADGEVGPKTWAALDELVKAEPEPEPVVLLPDLRVAALQSWLGLRATGQWDYMLEQNLSTLKIEDWKKIFRI